MDRIEVILKPDFNSADSYLILGLRAGADEDEITKAYRDLSRSYHPEKTPGNKEAVEIFVKVRQAYEDLVNDSDVEEQSPTQQQSLTSIEAKEAYDDKFGRYRKSYFADGGVIGIPYAVDLKTIFERTKGSRDSLSLGRICFFRSWLIKKDIDVMLAFLEPIFTILAATTCGLSFFVDDGDYEWYIDVFGGIGLLLSISLMHLWYGVTRYPDFFDKNSISWILGFDSDDEDMDDIRDVCSRAFHGDNERRDQVFAFITCGPIVLVDQLCSIFCVVLSSIFLCPIRSSMGLSDNTERFLKGAAKSSGALLSAVIYYLAWVFGGCKGKIFSIGVLFLNQSLYTCMLLRMDFFEYLQLVCYRGLFCFVEEISSESKEKGANENDGNEETNIAVVGTKSTQSRSICNGAPSNSSKRIKKAVPETRSPDPRSPQSTVSRKTTNTKSSAVTGSEYLFSYDDSFSEDIELENYPTFHEFGEDGKSLPSNYENIRVVPSSASYLSNYVPPPKGTKTGYLTVNQAGEVYVPALYPSPSADTEKVFPTQCSGGGAWTSLLNTFKQQIGGGLLANVPEGQQHQNSVSATTNTKEISVSRGTKGTKATKRRESRKADDAKRRHPGIQPKPSAADSGENLFVLPQTLMGIHQTLEQRLGSAERKLSAKERVPRIPTHVSMVGPSNSVDDEELSVPWTNGNGEEEESGDITEAGTGEDELESYPMPRSPVSRGATMVERNRIEC